MDRMFLERTERLCEIIGIKIPVFQGGMAYVSGHRLAAAVSESGALGTIAAGGLTAKELQAEICALKGMTNCNFAVNIPMKSENLSDMMAVIKDEKVPVVITGAGNPEKYIEFLKSSGTVVIPVVASVALAKRLVRYGADALIAEGSESGGHIGSVSTMCLIPQIVDTVEVPVIAAGGIADARGIAAAFMLGASGVQMGTRFLVTEESNACELYKEKVVRANDIATVVLNATQTDKDCIRALKSPITSRYLEAEYGKEPLEGLLTNALRQAVWESDLDKGIFMAGQCAGMIKGKEKAGELVDRLWTETCRMLS